MYIFESLIEVKNTEKDILVIFSGDRNYSDIDIGKHIEGELQKYSNRPEELFIIFPEYLSADVEDALSQDGVLLSAITRFKDIPVTAISFDRYARFKKKEIRGESSLCFDLNRLSSEIIRTGLFSLAYKHRDQVIMKSPSGTIFIKPSNAEHDEFIRAGGLAVGSAENQFVAFCLLSMFPRDRDIKKIYIDTSSISVFIEVVLYYISMFTKSEKRTISFDSFSSYDGKDIKRPDITDDIWLVISASMSNNLGKEMAQEWGLKNDQIITILSYNETDEDDIGDQILVNILGLSTSTVQEADNGSLIKVKVVGEHFTAEVEKPNPVLIKAKHKTPAIASWIDNNNSSGLIKCNVKPSPVSPTSPIHINCNESFLKTKEIENWLQRTISWYIPTQVKWLIYQKGKTVDECFKKIISQKLNENGISEYSCIDILDAETQVLGDGSAIIIMPVISSGESFLKLNRNLRISGHTGNRIYISPFAIFDTHSNFEKFKTSLLYGPNGMKYLFYSKYQAFVGHSSEVNSWLQELKVVENLSDSFWFNRAAQLRNQAVGLNGNIGTPSLDINKPLEFTNDFAFWKSGYNPKKVNHEVVYLTISTILQGLREKKLTQYDTDSLFSHVYQHSVIAPDNFTRFNDSLIQSCLWRAANSRELDYRSSSDLSESFSSILSRLIQDNVNGIANSALDILMGIATNKIKISNKNLKEILEKSRSKYSKKSINHATELIDYILGMEFPNEHNSNDDTIIF